MKEKIYIMKFAFIVRIILLTSVAITITNCHLFKKGQRNSSGNNVDRKPASTGSSDCDYGVRIFNQQAAGAIMSDIGSIYSTIGSIPDDMRRLYPAAKTEWNSVLNHVQRNYSSGYTVTVLKGLTTEEVKNWRNKNLEDYQRFFLLLAEYRYGKYPAQTHDILKQLGWIEKADAKKRLDAYVKNMITTKCHSIDSESIKRLLSPVLLPDSIEACYR